MGKNFLLNSIVVRKKFYLRNMSIDIGGMRIKYKDKDDTFLETHLVSKEPFGQFKAWFEEACSRKEILEPNAMCLATVSKGGYIIRPRAVEFWQGQKDRLHDRIKFRKPLTEEVPDGKLLHEGEDGWVYERLSP